MNIDAMNLAINTYFGGERREMLVILAGCALAVALACALYVVARDGFSAGFGVLALIASLLLASTSVSLLRRDQGHQAQLMASLGEAQAKQALSAEAIRIDAVIANYKYYRYVAIALSLLALLSIAMTRNGPINGIAAALLLLASAQMVVDHYSEDRAQAYASKLSASAGAGA